MDTAGAGLTTWRENQDQSKSPAKYFGYSETIEYRLQLTYGVGQK